MMSLVRGQPWKDIRSAVSPAFTTGKIKRVHNNNQIITQFMNHIHLLMKMSVMIEECAQRLADKFGDIAKTEGKIDAKS